MSPRARAVVASGKGDYLPVGTAGATARFPARGLGIQGSVSVSRNGWPFLLRYDGPCDCHTAARAFSYETSAETGPGDRMAEPGHGADRNRPAAGHRADRDAGCRRP